MASISLLFACTTQRFSSAAPTAGFWYQAGSVVLPADVTARLNGPLKDSEIESIKQLSRMEIDHAFSGLSIVVTTDPNAFWRVEVLQSLPVRMNQKLPNNNSDVSSYEYGSPDRASQDDGDLHWTTALPLLNKKLRP